MPIRRSLKPVEAAGMASLTWIPMDRSEGCWTMIGGAEGADESSWEAEGETRGGAAAEAEGETRVGMAAEAAT